MPIKPKNSKKRNDSCSSSIFTTSEEALSVVLEVEDVIARLKVWLTRMEQQLFSSQGSMENLKQEQLENKKTELEVNEKDQIINFKGVYVCCSALESSRNSSSDRDL